jgi:hypothetical protein
MKTINTVPTWQEATSIYIDVLRNNNSGFHALQAAKDELLRMAQILDEINRNVPEKMG